MILLRMMCGPASPGGAKRCAMVGRIFSIVAPNSGFCSHLDLSRVGGNPPGSKVPGNVARTESSWGVQIHPIRVRRDHPIRDSDGAVDGEQRLGEGGFEVAIAGRAGATVLSAFADLEVSVEGDRTFLRGIVPDQAALFGVLERIQNLGLSVLEVQSGSRGG